MKKKIVLIITVLLLVGCGIENTVETPQPADKRDSIMETYPFANSTDIYTATERYALDGTNMKGINLISSYGLDCSVMCVNDKWLYYVEGDEEGTGNLKRVPLRKGKDKRDIIDTKNVENIRDTQYENGFTVLGDYYVGISYGTVGIVYNMNTGETVRRKVPKKLSYPAKMEREDKHWWGLEQGRNWVLWENDYGVMLQKIPSGEMWIVEEGDRTIVSAKKENCFVYSIDEQSCYLYDIERNKRKIIMKKEQVCKAICSGLGISEAELNSFYIDDFMVKDDEFYMQLKVKTTQKDSIEHRYVMLTQKQGEDELFAYDENLNSILKNYAVKRQKGKKKKETYADIKFAMNVDGYWFLEDDGYYCYYYYDEKTKIVRQIDANDPKWNICYALYEDGLESI